MKRRIAFLLCHSLFLFALINVVNAASQSFADQFLGSPLLVLAALIIIDAIAFVYHRIRK